MNRNKRQVVLILLITAICTFFLSCKIYISLDALKEAIANAAAASSSGSGGGGSSPYSSNGTSVPTGGQSQVSLNGKFVRPQSGSSFSLKPSENCDIWYLFTNTSNTAVNKPNIPQGNSANILSNDFNLKDISTIENKGGLKAWKVDWRPEEVILPLSFIEDTINLETKNITPQRKDLNDASGETVGTKRTFYDIKRSGDKSLSAVCKVRKSVDTPNGRRILLIYVEEGLSKAGISAPSDSELNIIANAFLNDGKNDIYGKVTGMFGNDWGYWNYDYLSSVGLPNMPVIHNDGTITLLYCNLGRQGNLGNGGYTAGYFYNGNTFLGGGDSNERAMVTLHAPASCGSNLGEGLTTIAHEFQHLIHDQYFDSNLSNYAQYNSQINAQRESNSSINECFSAIAEIYVADFIASKSSQVVPGPFMVGYRGASDDRGYLDESDSSSALINGRGPEFLEAMDNTSLTDWDNSLQNYGIVASFGHYLLVNYGKDVITKYMQSGVADLPGIVNAIKAVNSKSTITQESLVADWGTAVMLSKRTDLSSPYTFNRHGWYRINGLDVPSVNMWVYKYGAGYSTRGVSSSSKSSLAKYTNTAYKVASVGANQTYSATAPSLPSGVILTVVAVPR